jgi:nucleoside-diphosphate-sugar epimerase
VETSVNRLADITETVSGLRTGRVFRAARKGELAWSVLDVSALKALGWSPRTPLVDGLRETFRWIETTEGAAQAGHGAGEAGP